MHVQDRHGRPVMSLRLSITGRCNVNCIYCHRDGMTSSRGELSAADIEKLCRVASDLGVGKIRLSGGEPLIRDDIVEIVERINNIGFRDISITTNGTLLEGYSTALSEAGLDSVNVSFDTLNPATYRFITRKDYLERVKSGISSAVDVGLDPVKINMVILRGVNHHEVWDMFEFCREKGAVLQIIELLKTESCHDDAVERYHCDITPIEAELAERADRIRTRKFMQDRKKYYIDGGEIEVVRPMDNTRFCANCTRLRVTPDGKLKPCLLRNDNLVDTRDALRENDTDLLRELFFEAIRRRSPYYTP
ncbi:MAG: GTP 3',8-cyclase MoaA [Methanothermobacter sp.]|nr:GTP 3',8-cyclase MoaA [Methanothermobacter sp.]